MPVTIYLDNQQSSHFTNLDLVTGKVGVHLRSETAIAGIQVKLEGESRTRLEVKKGDKQRTETEVHKVRTKKNHLVERLGHESLFRANPTDACRYCTKCKMSFLHQRSSRMVPALPRIPLPRARTISRFSSR